MIRALPNVGAPQGSNKTASQHEGRCNLPTGPAHVAADDIGLVVKPSSSGEINCEGRCSGALAQLYHHRRGLTIHYW